MARPTLKHAPAPRRAPRNPLPAGPQAPEALCAAIAERRRPQPEPTAIDAMACTLASTSTTVRCEVRIPRNIANYRVGRAALLALQAQAELLSGTQCWAINVAWTGDDYSRDGYRGAVVIELVDGSAAEAKAARATLDGAIAVAKAVRS
jgi:hypothetical protein